MLIYFIFNQEKITDNFLGDIDWVKKQSLRQEDMHSSHNNNMRSISGSELIYSPCSPIKFRCQVRVRTMGLLLKPEKEPVLHLFGHATCRKKRTRLSVLGKAKWAAVPSFGIGIPVWIFHSLMAMEVGCKSVLISRSRL